MKGSVVAFDKIDGREAAAWIEDGRLHDLLVDPPEDRIRPGAIYRARAGRPMKGQGGMMLDTPDGSLFLRQVKGIAAGDMVFAQASTYAERGKAAPATLRLVFKSRYCLATPGAPGLNVSKAIRDEDRVVALRDLAREHAADDGIGLIVRSAAAGADETAVAEDIAATFGLARRVLAEPESGAPACLLAGPGAHDLAWRDWPAPATSDTEAGSFERHDVGDMIDAVRGAHVALAAGASMFVEPTRALVAIDVNTGGDTSPAAGLKANVAALRALPRALRLRGLGGQVVIDFAPFAKRDRTQIEQVARAALRADGIETALVGWTPLGHLELQRKRERLPLTECLT